MTATELHLHFHEFAGGMPAIAVSTDVISKEIDALGFALAGIYPDTPAKSCKNIKIGKYKLAFSVFVTTVDFKISSGKALLEADLIATIHPDGDPGSIIRQYDVKTITPQQLFLDYQSTSKEAYWQPNGLSVPEMNPSWGKDYKEALKKTTIPDDQEETFMDEIEPLAISGGQSTFFNLLIDLLPRFSLHEIAPWITFLEPLQTSFSDDHLVLTSPLATLEIGGCSPKTVQVRPDPDFPYGESLPEVTYSGQDVDYAVYFPKSRLVGFAAELIQPAIMVNSGVRGGLIKWQASGAIGLKSFDSYIQTGVAQDKLQLLTTLGISALIDFVGAARAWVDGPSGTKIGLASASIQASGDFAAKIQLTVNIPARVVEARLIVERSRLPHANFDVDTGLPWPIDDIISEIISHIAKDEVKKLTGTVVQLGRWDFFGLPLSYVNLLEALGGVTSVPYYEGAQNLSAIVGVLRHGDSEIPRPDEEG